MKANGLFMQRVKRRSQYKRQWLVGDSGKWLLIALLVLAFPVGLYLMWDEGKWRLWLKILISALWTAIIVLVIVLLLGTGEPEQGGQKNKEIDRSTVIVNTEVAANSQSAGEITESGAIKMVYDGRLLAPLPPKDVPGTSQIINNITEGSTLISEPTPTPVPTMVYCNDNGKYYHLAGCIYVYKTTPKVTLNAAKNAGKTACPTCKPPTEETYGN